MLVGDFEFISLKSGSKTLFEIYSCFNCKTFNNITSIDFPKGNYMHQYYLRIFINHECYIYKYTF